MSDHAEKPKEGEFDLAKLVPELQAKVFEGLPDLHTAVALRLTCRDLNALFLGYRSQIEAAIRANMELARREALVAPFYEYYHFLGTMHIPEEDIKYPPRGGWPSITAETFAALGKSDFALSVLRHMPFIVDRNPWNLRNIGYRCNVVDYSRATPQTLEDLAIRDELMTRHGRGGPAAEHTLLIARGYGIARDVHLDTDSGMIYEDVFRDRDVGITWESDLDVAMPLREYVEMRMEQCRTLQQVFIPGEDCNRAGLRMGEVPYDAAAMEEAGEPGTRDIRAGYFSLMHDTDLQWVRHLYRRFGWPGEGWRKEECMNAITEYVQRRDEEYGILEEQRNRTH